MATTAVSTAGIVTTRAAYTPLAYYDQLDFPQLQIQHLANTGTIGLQAGNTANQSVVISATPDAKQLVSGQHSSWTGNVSVAGSTALANLQAQTASILAGSVSGNGAYFAVDTRTSGPSGNTAGVYLNQKSTVPTVGTWKITTNSMNAVCFQYYLSSTQGWVNAATINPPNTPLGLTSTILSTVL